MCIRTDDCKGVSVAVARVVIFFFRFFLLFLPLCFALESFVGGGLRLVVFFFFLEIKLLFEALRGGGIFFFEK